MNTLDSHPISHFLDPVELGVPQESGRLRLWPLIQPGAPASEPRRRGTPCVPLADALRARTLDVEEVDSHGQVPHLRLTNRGELPVLILYGQELIGMKQNRVVNATFLVPAHSKLVIDVSCTEQGRWHRGLHSTRVHGGDTVSARLRQTMARDVTESLAVGAGYRADQSAVWREVSHRLSGARASSRTAAYRDYADSREHETRRLERAFEVQKGQVGFVAEVDGELLGVEAVGDPELYRSVWKRLLRGYAVDAVDAVEGDRRWFRRRSTKRSDSTNPADFDWAAFKRRVAMSEVTSSESLGEGSDLRVKGAGLAGCALASEHLLHVMLFPA